MVSPAAASPRSWPRMSLRARRLPWISPTAIVAMSTNAMYYGICSDVYGRHVPALAPSSSGNSLRDFTREAAWSNSTHESLPGSFGEAAAHVTEPRIQAQASDMQEECAH